MTSRFRDRADAGRRLASALAERLGPAIEPAPVVLGLPRGGVVVAAEVAAALGAPLDVLVVRKLGVPAQPELAFGAIGEDGPPVLNADVVTRAGLDDAGIGRVVEKERAELARRVLAYRGDRPPLDVEGRTAIVVDDGIATGATALAALRVVRGRRPARLVLAAPAAPPSTVAELGRETDLTVVLLTPEAFYAVGQWYDDFRQTTDEEVVAALEVARG